MCVFAKAAGDALAEDTESVASTKPKNAVRDIRRSVRRIQSLYSVAPKPPNSEYPDRCACVR